MQPIDFEIHKLLLSSMNYLCCCFHDKPFIFLRIMPLKWLGTELFVGSIYIPRAQISCQKWHHGFKGGE
jgi:hypothetical protein